MNVEQDMHILEALVELKNQIKNLRNTLDPSMDDDSSREETRVSDHVSNQVSPTEEYRIAITPQEMNELLFTPPSDTTPHQNPVSGQSNHDEITQLSNDLSNLRESTEKNINDLKKSIVALSEMFGRHEIEIQKIRK